MRCQLSVVTVFFFILAGCVSFPTPAKMSSEQVAQGFIDHLQYSRFKEAHALLTRGQSERTGFDEFKDVILSLQEQMGRIEDNETALMPFHKPADDSSFIPLRVPAKEVKRYIYTLRLSHASINCDLTVVPEDGQYKIAWFSFWK